MYSNRLVPEDVVIEILSWVPAESLMRLKCVHKSWYILIQDSEFVALQLRNQYSSKNNNNYILMMGGREFTVMSDGLKRTDMSLSVLKYDGEVVSSVMKDEELSVYNHQNYDLTLNCFDMYPPCDGLTCLSGYGDCVIIANPAIRQYRALPKSCVPIPPPDIHGYCEYALDTTALGLGIDLQTNKYKVVRIFAYWDTEFAPKYEEGNRFDVEVYTFGSNSWRQIEDAYYIDMQFSSQLMSIYWNGAYYWCTWKYTTKVRGLYSFNFTDEAFQFIEIPEYIFFSPYRPSLMYYGIIEFNAAPSLLTTHHHPEAGEWFEIWNMEDGFGGTWTKLFSSEPLPPMYSPPAPLGSLKKDQLLLLLENGQLASFSFLTSQLKLLPPPTHTKFTYCSGFVGYKSTLVSFDTHNN